MILKAHTVTTNCIKMPRKKFFVLKRVGQRDRLASLRQLEVTVNAIFVSREACYDCNPILNTASGIFYIY